MLFSGKKLRNTSIKELAIWLSDFALIVICMVTSSSLISHASLPQIRDSEKERVFKPVIEKLLAKGADTLFVYKLINDPNATFDDNFIKINVTGYLKKADYTSHYSSRSVRKTKDFVKRNADVLDACEEKYGVPKEFIASILWIETRHGSYLGGSHISSVFLSAALADEEEYVKMNKEALRQDFSGDSLELRRLEEKIEKRSAKKADWALNELLAIEELSKRSPIPYNEIKGSWAGAFGISQFLPSSYVKWAVDGDGDGIVNLFDEEDAIYSVANYLTVNGWGEDIESRRKAVYHYNNSSAYVDAVFKLAEKITPKFRKPINKQLNDLDK